MGDYTMRIDKDHPRYAAMLRVLRSRPPNESRDYLLYAGVQWRVIKNGEDVIFIAQKGRDETLSL